MSGEKDVTPLPPRTIYTMRVALYIVEDVEDIDDKKAL
jgi:hypothetical protein